jgi:prepilin-type N-terminal cleavage/methylation domain-containing protein
MLRRSLRRIADEQNGFTLIEQLVSTVVFLLVMSAVLALLESANKVAPRDQERASAITEAQIGLHRMVRELRQAERVDSLESGSITVRVRLPRDNPNTGTVETHSLWDVRYTCNAETPGKCTRWATLAGGSYPSTGETVIDRIVNWQTSVPASRKVFTLGQGTAIAPQYISVRIEVPAKGERTAGHAGTVILQDGFAPRNIN